MIVHFGDLHIQNKEPFRTAGLLFLSSIVATYKEHTIISGGDIFDSSSLHHELMDAVVDIIKEAKDFRIVSGNHSQSDRLGNILLPLRHHSNITVYDEKTEFEIDGISFIALPSLPHYEKEYESIQGNWDYSICHFEPIQESFNNSGIELKFKTNTAHLFSHIHRHREFKDNFGNNVLITGSVISTRYGEQDWAKNIYIIHKDHYEAIPVGQYFTFEDVEYNEMPTNKNNIINIKNAPSINSVYDMYKGYYIREEGITFKQDTLVNLNDISLDSSNLENQFIEYNKQPNIDIPNDIQVCCINHIRAVM